MENIFKIAVMVIIGIIGGSIAARAIGGRNFGLLINALLGIAGAIVGGLLFDWLNLTPGSNIVRIIDKTFDVQLPQNFIGMLVSAIVGAILILIVAKFFTGGFGRARRQ